MSGSRASGDRLRARLQFVAINRFKTFRSAPIYESEGSFEEKFRIVLISVTLEEMATNESKRTQTLRTIQ